MLQYLNVDPSSVSIRLSRMQLLRIFHMLCTGSLTGRNGILAGLLHFR